MNNIGLALITGLTTGGISCFAVQGGLLTSSLASDAANTEDKILSRHAKVASFLLAKILAYSALGFFLGSIGSSFVISSSLLALMQIMAGIFMLGTALRLLNVHPIFRYFAFEPPKWAYRIIRTESKNKSLFTPVILGTLTVLIPCGVTQAMIALALASANPLTGAGIMFAFTLGSSPVFFAMGMTISVLLKKRVFVYASSLALVLIGVLSINSGQVLRGSVHTLGNYAKAVKGGPNVLGSGAVVNAMGIQEAKIDVFNAGYKADTGTLKVGVPVKLKLVSNNVTSCARSFVIPSQNISRTLGQNGETFVEFTPTKTGRLTYSCGMGMYTGEFKVVEQ